MNKHAITAQPVSPIPPDDPQRKLALARPNEDEKLPHIALMGDTYTVLLSGDDTDGRYCLIDMMIPPGGGPGPHRHDFEESFTILEGEIPRPKFLDTGAISLAVTIGLGQPNSDRAAAINRSDPPLAAKSRRLDASLKNERLIFFLFGRVH